MSMSLQTPADWHEVLEDPNELTSVSPGELRFVVESAFGAESDLRMAA